MFLRIPVYWVEDNYESKEDCGIEPKYTLGDIVINTGQLCGYHVNDKDEVMIRMSNGDVFRTPFAYDNFVERYPDLMFKMELIIDTDTNVQ